ncbi:hypothetical protein EPK97_18000 [Chengkuizengella sediminis]|nr:hypothetical protein [Chengkuizengella sediminis]
MNFVYMYTYTYTDLNTEVDMTSVLKFVVNHEDISTIQIYDLRKNEKEKNIKD